MTYWSIPRPYPEELSYSMVARYLRSWGYPKPSALLPKLLGGSHRALRVDIGLNVHEIAKACQFARQDGDLFARRHTLLLYHFAFLTPPSFKSAMRQTRSLALGAQSARMCQLIDMNASERPHMRFCPQCQLDHFKTFGETYWVRQHQLPCARFCVPHGRRLLRSTVPVVSGNDRSEGRFVAATEKNCDASSDSLEPLQYPESVEWQLTLEGCSLLRSERWFNGYIKPSGYRELLKTKSLLLKGNKRVDAEQLVSDMREFLQMPAPLQCHPIAELVAEQQAWWNSLSIELPSRLRQATWVASLSRAGHPNIRPDQHLLFRMFLVQRPSVRPKLIDELALY
jgi:hypothetical protein